MELAELRADILYSMDWHSDISFEAVPADYTMLKLHTLPARGGGDTMWAS